MSDFNSLALALDTWLSTPLQDLPPELQKRIKQDFSPMPWDELSPDERLSVAKQWDYQHDPATEQERESWFNFYVKKGGLEAEIAKCETIATPTALDLEAQHRLLADLKSELALMQKQELQASKHEKITKKVENKLNTQQAPAIEKKAMLTPNNTNKTTNDCLQNKPQRKDEWFSLIRDMRIEFINEYDRSPNDAEAWVRLKTQPPASYGITSGKHKGKDTIFMGDIHLSKQSFMDRLKRYTQ